MQDKTLFVVDNDVICQWLMGDELKRNQLCFLYEVLVILYNSPARKHLLDENKDLLEKTIPMITAFETILKMKTIIVEKEDHEKKMKKLAEPILPVDDVVEEKSPKLEEPPAEEPTEEVP